MDNTPTESVLALARRASDKGYLRLKWAEYLSLLDWTGRQVRSDKRGAIPTELAPILDRLQVRADKWLDTISQFGRRFRRAVGNAACVAARAEQQGRHWYQGIRNCESAFG